MAAAAIDGAKTAATVESMREKGASDTEIVKAILPPDELTLLARSIHIEIQQLLPMGWAIGLPREIGIGDNKAFIGKAHLAQHYTDTPEAIAYWDMWENAATVRDVWEFFLKCNGLPDDVLVNKPGYDHAYVQSHLNQPLMETSVAFGINKEESEKAKLK